MTAAQTVELLRRARERYSQRELSSLIGVSQKTIARWEHGHSTCPMLAEPALMRVLADAPHFYDAECQDFTFIDLFAGIGGIRLGFEKAGGRCVFTSEWDEQAKRTYLANFGDGHPFVGNIIPFPASEVPDHDVLLAGFPCQPFSIAGVSKKNSLGRPHGFECTTQGTLFFDVARIIAEKRPAAFLLENVKNLVGHNRGNTFRVILQTLREELGYEVHYKVIDGGNFVPQHRERILIIGFREPTSFFWNEFQFPAKGPRMGSVLHPEDGSESAEPPYTFEPAGEVSDKYVLSDRLWRYLQDYAAKHRAAGNGFGYGLVDRNSQARTLSARYYKDGSEILVSRGEGQTPRRLTPRECARLMGFPDSFRIPVSDTQAYRQFGNSVVVPVMAEAARIMKPHVLQVTRHGRPVARQQLLMALT